MAKEDNKGNQPRPVIRPTVNPPASHPKPGANRDAGGGDTFEKGITSAKPPERPKK